MLGLVGLLSFLLSPSIKLFFQLFLFFIYLFFLIEKNEGCYIYLVAKNLGSSTVSMAELWGIYTALEIAWIEIYDRVWIECDFELQWVSRRRGVQIHTLMPL